MRGFNGKDLRQVSKHNPIVFKCMGFLRTLLDEINHKFYEYNKENKNN